MLAVASNAVSEKINFVGVENMYEKYPFYIQYRTSELSEIVIISGSR